MNTRTHLLTYAALAAALLIAPLASAAPSQGASEYQVFNIDVGQGSATLVRTLGGKHILMDTGWDFAGPRLVAALEKYGVKKLDAVVVSHRHMDHIGGVGAISEKIPVAKVIGPWAKDGIPITAMVHLAKLRKDVTKDRSATNRPLYETATAGKVFDFGNGFSLETVWPKVPSSGKRIGDYNEESVSMRVVQKSPSGKAATFYYGGDLGNKEERYLGQKQPGKLRSDWIVGDHHGSAGSGQREFMVALDGGYSKMLKALIAGPECNDQQCYKATRKFWDLAKKGSPAIPTILKQLDPVSPKINLNPDGWMAKLVNELKYQTQRDPHGANRYAIYSVGPNSYGHPNAIRLAEAQLAGFTPVTTWGNGTILMSRKLDKNGDWAGDWAPSRLSTRDLPKVYLPKWLGRQDPQRPYNSDRREANWHWTKLNPQREVKWTDPWDANLTWRNITRETSAGRKNWVEEYVVAKNDALNGTRNGAEPANDREREANKKAAATKLKGLQYQGKEWHGLDLDSMQNLTKEQLRKVALASREGISTGEVTMRTRRNAQKTRRERASTKGRTSAKTTTPKVNVAKTTSQGSAGLLATLTARSKGQQVKVQTRQNKVPRFLSLLGKDTRSTFNAKTASRQVTKRDASRTTYSRTRPVSFRNFRENNRLQVRDRRPVRK